MSTALKKGDTVKLVSEKYGTWRVIEEATDMVKILERMEFGRAGRSRLVSRDHVTKVCGVSVSDGGRSVGTHDCGKPIKNEELGMCGVHASAVKRRQAGDVERFERRAANNAELDAIREELKTLGVDALAHTTHDRDFITRWTGNVVLSMTELRRILNREEH
jgi:hypothetical protein